MERLHLTAFLNGRLSHLLAMFEQTDWKGNQMAHRCLRNYGNFETSDNGVYGVWHNRTRQSELNKDCCIHCCGKEVDLLSV